MAERGCPRPDPRTHPTKGTRSYVPQGARKDGNENARYDNKGTIAGGNLAPGAHRP